MINLKKYEPKTITCYLDLSLILIGLHLKRLLLINQNWILNLRSTIGCSIQRLDIHKTLSFGSITQSIFIVSLQANFRGVLIISGIISWLTITFGAFFLTESSDEQLVLAKTVEESWLYDWSFQFFYHEFIMIEFNTS